MLEALRHGETEDKKDEALDDRLSVIAGGEELCGHQAPDGRLHGARSSIINKPPVGLFSL